jgi:hypothetical protein
MSLLAGATVLVFAAPAAWAAPPLTTTSPAPGFTASCPPSTNSVAAGTATISGVKLTGINGTCTTSQAHAVVSVAQFGANAAYSLRADCTVNGTPTSSAVYNGSTITGQETITTADGYILRFNVPVSVGGQAGRIALEIVTPSGAVVDLAEVLCAGAAYPLSAQLNTQQPSGLSPVSTSSHGGGTSTALLLLGGALVAFVIVNVTAVRRFRHRHNGMVG